MLETPQGSTCSGQRWDRSPEPGRAELPLLPSPPGIRDPVTGSSSSPPSPGLPNSPGVISSPWSSDLFALGDVGQLLLLFVFGFMCLPHTLQTDPHLPLPTECLSISS